MRRRRGRPRSTRFLQRRPDARAAGLV